MGDLWDQTIRFFFPPFCVLCKTPGSWICDKCRNRALISSLPECVHCRKISSNFSTHSGCFKKFPISQGVILWMYNRLAREIMKKLKLDLRYRILVELLDIGKEKVVKFVPKDSILVPVPSTPRRIRDRGFNQTLLICKKIAKMTGAKIADTLERLDETHQTGQSRKDRLNQSGKTYKLKDSAMSVLEEKDLIIVDDVCTTGTTIKNCALALAQAQPLSINSFTLFRGKRPQNKLSAKRAGTAGTGRTGSTG